MSNEITRPGEILPAFFDDFFKPWNQWFSGGNGNSRTMPAANVLESQNDFSISLAVPGMKKEDFTIDVDGNILTIGCQKEDNKVQNDARHTRREYNYSSFSRSFTMPEEVLKDKIDATYHDGILKLILPKNEAAKKAIVTRHIAVK